MTTQNEIQKKSERVRTIYMNAVILVNQHITYQKCEIGHFDYNLYFHTAWIFHILLGRCPRNMSHLT